MSQRKTVKLEIYGKVRIIRDIRQDDDEFYAYYRNHAIHVQKAEMNFIYAWCNAPDGGYIVDGYVTLDTLEDSTIDDGIRVCLENILYNEKPVEVVGV